MDHASALLAGRNELGWEAIQKITCRAIVIGTGIAVLLMKPSLLPVTMSMAAASGVAVVIAALIVRSRFGEFGAALDAEALRKLVRSSLPLLGFTSFWIFYDNQDILLLHHFHIIDSDIGLYWSASKIIDVLRVFPVLLMGAFFPTLARQAATRETYLQTSRTLLGYAALAIPAVVVSVYWAAPFLETLFYGPQFLGAAALLRLLLPAFAATFLNHICMQMLITKDLELKLLSASVVACISNFVLNWFLIPRYGPPGVCYSLIISEWLFLSFQIRWIVEAVPGLFNPFRRHFG
jgi:O-antigen/teichoic acid export membrane protein